MCSWCAGCGIEGSETAPADCRRVRRALEIKNRKMKKGGEHMATITLGRTGLRVEQNGFGALPIQRISKSEAVRLLRRAQDTHK